MDIPDFRVIRPDVSVYLYYAGRSRKYMRISQIENSVFLDLPGFHADQDTFSSDEKIVQALNRADAVRRYLRDPSTHPRPGAASTFPTSIPYIENKVDRSFLADLGNVRTMFVDMKAGDIVIMTPSDHYDRLLIGEVTSGWHEDDLMGLPEQGNYTLPFRRVKWLSHSLSRRDFPSAVARRLQNRKAITKIDIDYYESIFRFLYSAYIWGNTSKLDVFGPGYNRSDPTSNAEASFLIKYAVAYYAAFQAGKIEHFNSLDIEDAADRYFDEKIVLQIAQSFGSPGGYVNKLIGGGAAAAVALILSVALSNEAHTAQAANQHAVEQAEDMQKNYGSDLQTDLPGLAGSLRAGNSGELRRNYGRPARSKIGMTLHGERPPELTVKDGMLSQ